MIKFFRKTRQKLINEGSLKRYLKYSIGEVLLVVIGILLALQVNNLNLNRNNKITESIYIDRLTNELVLEIEYYKDLRTKFIQKEKRLKRIINIWQSDKGTVLDSLQYINDFNQAGEIDPWYNAPITWNQLIQTGDLKLLKDQEIVDALYKHNNLAKRIADNYLMHPMTMTNKARENWTEPFINENLNVFFYSSGIPQIPSTEVYHQIWQNKNKYLQLYIEIAFVSLIQSEHLKELIESGESLLFLLTSNK